MTDADRAKLDALQQRVNKMDAKLDAFLSQYRRGQLQTVRWIENQLEQ